MRYGRLALGNNASEKPGIRPRTVGPSRIPATTSAITFGWRTRAQSRARPLEKKRMSESWTMKSVIGLAELKATGEWPERTPGGEARSEAEVSDALLGQARRGTAGATARAARGERAHLPGRT